MNKVVKVYSDQCGPCNKFAPVFDRAATQTNIPFESWHVDTDVDRSWLRTLGVNSIPTVLFYKDGEVFKIVKGSETTERQILDTVEELYLP